MTGTDKTRSWLGLLAADASRAELHDHRAALLENADVEARRETETDGAHADVIKNHLEDRRQTARELAALNDLARRLATLRDTREVLHEVCVQARQLLGVDVAYIMLRHGEQDLRIETADGSMGSVLRGIVLGAEEGLGGLVLRHGRPLWSEDYLGDPRLRRGRPLETAATSEQLGGILGVPLQVRDEGLGVLLAAERRPRRFSEREVELLAGLAAHAAVALRNAELFEQHVAALAELRESNRSLQRTIAARQQANDLREDLWQLMIRGGDVPGIAEVLSRAVGLPVLILDAAGRPLTPEVPEAAELEALLGPQSPGEWFERRRSRTWSEGERHFAGTMVALPDGCAGCVLVAGAEPVEADAVRLLEIAAATVGMAVAGQRAVAEAELRARGEFVSALLAPDGGEVSVRRRARAAGIDLDALRTVVVLAPADGEERATTRLAARLAAELGGWSAEHGSGAVALLPRVDPQTVRDRVLVLGDGALPAAVGVAACDGGGPAGMREAHESARQTAALLQALARERDVALVEELGIYRSVFSRAGRHDIRAFVQATIGRLVEHDRAKQSDLTRTCEVFLGEAQHHARTCEALNIHANTLYHRLDRVTELLGEGWRGPERAWEIQLALRMRHLMAARNL
ncbi:GAF domain-containing protein [Streptomyces sp. YC504]|uniref:GAF domain-containing protein n=1 Tax=Streptomyces mesophilus TaxID=1775132 RepID=A0A6G4XUV9_9ACTN|nr:GAF domain-containing protein [Streptomyces mesophilus]NGO80391.1 GAF domain-containing protein [Streptomyces mesophilus]